MLINGENNNHYNSLKVSNDEFQNYVYRHKDLLKKINTVIDAENNEALIESNVFLFDFF